MDTFIKYMFDNELTIKLIKRRICLDFFQKFIIEPTEQNILTIGFEKWLGYFGKSNFN